MSNSKLSISKEEVEELAIRSPLLFFEYELHHEPKFEYLNNDAARSLLANNPNFFIYLGIYKDERFDQFSELVLDNLHFNDYFSEGMHKERRFDHISIKKAKYFAFHDHFYFFRTGLHNDERFFQIAEEAAMYIAKTDHKSFMRLDLDKDKRFEKAFLIVLKNLK